MFRAIINWWRGCSKAVIPKQFWRHQYLCHKSRKKGSSSFTQSAKENLRKPTQANLKPSSSVKPLANWANSEAKYGAQHAILGANPTLRLSACPTHPSWRGLRTGIVAETRQRLIWTRLISKSIALRNWYQGCSHLQRPSTGRSCRAVKLARNPQSQATIPLGSDLTALTTSSRNTI
jgi:hypothetical protein